MATIFSGYESGLLNSSLTLLNRNDQTRLGAGSHGEQLYVNAANGNLVLQQQDAFLPSQGDDFLLIRTYNSRGRVDYQDGSEDSGWRLSTAISLRELTDENGDTFYEVEYGDGSVFDYHLDASTGRYVTTDGAGAFEEIELINSGDVQATNFILIRADQSRLSFDGNGRLLSWSDTNGVTIDYSYSVTGQLTQILDDQGHVITYQYLNDQLTSVVDESGTVLVEYRYNTEGLLAEVIDRAGHSTQYTYNADGLLTQILFPDEGDAAQSRQITIGYENVDWRGAGAASASVVSNITDAEGGLTSFIYDFDFVTIDNTDPRWDDDQHFQDDVNKDFTGTTKNILSGGATQVVDALGNQRIFSNDQQYRDWRVANGYYDLYDSAAQATLQLQIDAIRNAHSLYYSFREDGYITQVTDQLGFKTSYNYDAADNLSSVTDNNGWGVMHSDSNYYRQLRAELGVLDLAGNGKLVADLSSAELDLLNAAYTRHMAYDENGNLLSATDKQGNITTFTYTDFNKIASSTSALGHALVNSDEQFYQDKRVGLGYAALLADLSATDKQAILDSHSTLFSYDGAQNLIEIQDTAGDLTRIEYDTQGNILRRIVFLDKKDLTDPAKQQITQYFYDAFGNNVQIVDAEGNTFSNEFDHFGNLLRTTDGRGNITTYTYDEDDRLLTISDALGNTTANVYDAVGNLVSITDANGHTVTNIYDKNNNLITTIEPEDLAANSDGSNDRITQFTYDVVGNNTAVTDAEGNTTTFDYDTLHQRIAVTTEQVEGADGTLTRYTSTFAYDGLGNIIRSVNNRGFATEILYDRNSLVKQVTDANGHITCTRYDANNNRIEVISGVQLLPEQQQVIRFTYDERDRLIQGIDAEGGVTRYQYDAVGNRISITDANGNQAHFEYDGLNRVIREVSPEVIDSAGGQPVTYNVEHIYDANGNQVEQIDANGNSTKFYFDKLDRLVLTETAAGTKTVAQYDAVSNRTALLIGVDAHIDVNGEVVVTDTQAAQVSRYVYNEFGQLTEQVDAVGNALAENDQQLYQDLRAELGFASLVADLTDADKAQLRSLYTEYYSYDRNGNLLTLTDHLGGVTSRRYDALNRVSERSDALGETVTFRYDGNSNKVSETDALGHTSQYVFDSLDRQTDAINAAGVVAHQEFDSFGNLLTQTLAYGTPEQRTVNYEYDLNNRLIKSLDAEANLTQYEYDALGNRLKTIDARGNTTQNVYDALNRVIKVIDAQNFETRYEYDAAGNRITTIDARGAVSRFTFDADNRLISSTDAAGQVTTLSYDRRGNRIEQRTAVGTSDEQVTTYLYDAQNNLREVIDADGNVQTTDFDRLHRAIATTDGNGNTSQTFYDAQSRVIKTIDAAGGETSYEYDAVGNTVRSTNALGQISEFIYDELNRTIVQRDADGVETHFSYDDFNNQISITRAANTSVAVSETFRYDNNNQLIESTDAEGNSVSYEYDANNNRTVSYDANGNRSEYIYDANNRVAQIIDAEGGITQYVYDETGNRVQVIDSRGFARTTYFNINNQVELVVDAEGYATTFQYDNNGNAIAQTLYANRVTLPLDPTQAPTLVADAADQTVTFEYDALNRVSARIDAEGYRVEFTYDAVGNRLQTRTFLDRAGQSVATEHNYYDALNREVAVLTAEGHLVAREYDVLGRQVTSTVYDEPLAAPTQDLPQPLVGDSGRVESFEYDNSGRLIRETSPLGVITEFEYDARGNRTAIIEAAGTSAARRTEYTFDSNNRVVDTIDALGTVTHLVTDANGNVIERHDAYGTAQARVTYFSFDGNNRVIEDIDASGTVSVTTYDAAGNVISLTKGVGTAEETTEYYEYDGNNRRSKETNGEGDVTTSAYDAAGNRINLSVAPGLAEERVNTFEYDKDNRLIASVDGEGGRTEYRYDGAGNKLETIQAAGVAGEERHTFYVYDKDNRLLQITDPLGGVTQYEYDVIGNQTRIINPNNTEQINTFDNLGRLLTSLSPRGVLTTNDYDLRGNLVQVTQSYTDGSDARVTLYEYDILDRQTLITDQEGFSSQIDYDIFGNQTKVTHGLYLIQPLPEPYTGPAPIHEFDAAKAARAFAQSNTFSYDEKNQLLSTTDAEGNVTTYAYDGLGNRTAFSEASNSSARTTTYVYDKAGRLLESVNPEGGIQRREYNAAGNLVKEFTLQSVADDGTQIWSIKTYSYDANSRVSTEIDAEGNQTIHEYDIVGNEITLRRVAGTADEKIIRREYDLNNREVAFIDGEGNRTTSVYDTVGNRIQVIDALGNVGHFYFDAGGNLLSILDPEGFVNTFTYDLAGNRTEERIHFTPYSGVIDDLIPPTPNTSAADRITQTIFDKTGRGIARFDSDNSRTEYEYDAVGNLLTETAFANTSTPRVLNYSYDKNNRLISFVDIDGTVTEFTYDGANNKTAESVSHPDEPGVTRTNVYVYDLNNRLIEEIFDPITPENPNGLHFSQQTEYDRAGNIVARIDANGGVTRLTYNQNNQVITTTDATGNTTRFAYDAAGNQVSVTDARGYTTTFVYDGNNRQIEEIQPGVISYSIDKGFVTENPTLHKVYDASGNEVQSIDANGFITTRYFDSNNKQTAEINGDNVLRTWRYNAAGDQISETLYLTRLSATAHDPLTIPPVPGGEARTISREYDAAGRVTRVIYPQVEITSVDSSDPQNPLATTSLIQPQEQFVYDAFGNVIASTDKSGASSYSYYDSKGRLLAQLDAAGYLVEWDYDQQNNVIAQRIYSEPLDTAILDPSLRPAPPAGEVLLTTRSYDLANRLIEETGPQVEIYDPATDTSSFERITTLFAYDAAGNETRKTINAGTAQEFNEYRYYDAANRLIAVIDANRVINFFGYDAAGNQTLVKRFFNQLDAGVDLATLGGDTDFSSLVAANDNDQAIVRDYDARSLLSSETDSVILQPQTYTDTGGTTLNVLIDEFLDIIGLLGDPAADPTPQLVQYEKIFHYDSNGARTRFVDGDGFITQSQYNGVGNLVRTVTPDGVSNIYEYDAAGNQILLYSLSKDDGLPLAATVSSVLGGDQLQINWELPPAGNVQSFLVYDTVSRGSVDAYANQTTIVNIDNTASASVGIPLTGFSQGDTVYFRVVSVDAGGKQRSSVEQSVTIPPRVSDITIEKLDANSISVNASFETGALNPTLLYGPAGTAQQALSSIALQSSPTGWTAVINNATDPQQLVYRLQWSDSQGVVHTTDEIYVRSSRQLAAVSTMITETDNQDASYTLNLQTRLPDAQARNYSSIVAEWHSIGSQVTSSYSAAAVAGGDGFSSYDLILGDTQGLTGGDYEVTLKGTGTQGELVFDTFVVTVGNGSANKTVNSLTWDVIPTSNYQETQIVLVDGHPTASSHDAANDYITADIGELAVGAHTLDVYYGEASFSPPHTTTINFSGTGSNISAQIATALAFPENDWLDTDVQLAWHKAGTGDAYTTVSNLDFYWNANDDLVFTTTLTGLDAGQYDFKLYYTDIFGYDVIVDWLSADTAQASHSYDGVSFTVYGQETDGVLSQDAQGRITYSPGTFSSDYNSYVDTLTVSALNTELLVHSAPLNPNPVEGITAATHISTALGVDQLLINWDVPPNGTVQSYVVYDSVSRDNAEAYANQSASLNTRNSVSVSLGIPLTGFVQGNTLYYRVVSVDATGRHTASVEQSAIIPPRVTDIVIEPVDATSISVSASFEEGALNPTLLYGAAQGALSSIAFTSTPSGLSAVINNVTDPQQLIYRLQWSDSHGVVYTTDDIYVASSEQHIASSTLITETDNQDATYTLNLQSRLANADAQNYPSIVAEWHSTSAQNSISSYTALAMDNGDGFSSYDLILGDTQGLAAGDYEVTLKGTGAQGELVLDSFVVTVGNGTANKTENNLTWNIPPIQYQDTQIVLLDGQPIAASRDTASAYFNADIANLSIGNHSLNILYGEESSYFPPHTTTIDFTGSGSNISAAITTSISLDEVDELSDEGVLLAWRKAGTGDVYSSGITLLEDLSDPGGLFGFLTGGSLELTFNTTLSGLDAGQYDFKLYYTDFFGDEVILDWLTVDTAQASHSYTSSSFYILGEESGGVLNQDAQGRITYSPGVFSSYFSDSVATFTTSALSTELVTRSAPLDIHAIDGRVAGYYTENHYNALNVLLATNREAGNWTEYGVDANGNQVATYLYGEQDSADPRVAYSSFDARNRETQRIVAPVTPSDASVVRSVSEYEYDVNNNIIREVDAAGGVTTRRFSALGSLLSETDAAYNSKDYGYDRLGNQVLETDALGHKRVKFYDVSGNLVREVDARGDAIDYSYDAFNRRTTITNALGQTVQMEYDQRDRLVQVTDGEGGVTRYGYDDRNNRTLIIDANDHITEQYWDGLNRIADTVTYQDGVEIHNQVQYDAYGNKVAVIDGEGRIFSSVYGEFGIVSETIDEGGRRTFYEYDRFGQLLHEYSPDSGRDIYRSYDELGRLLSVNDVATGVSSTYSYDINGNRLTETITTPDNAHNRDISYQYDALNQMVRWADSVTGLHLNYYFDAAGNLVRSATDVGYDPDGDNLDLVSVLDQAEADIRAEEIMISFFGITASEPRYTGTLNEIIRDKLVDLGVDVKPFDRALKDPEADKISSTWSEDLLDHRATLKTILIALGYQQALDAATVEPDFYFVDNTYTYDANNRIASINQRDELITEYVYDAAGNRQYFNRSVVDTRGNASFDSTEYLYNANGRVIEAIRDGNTTIKWTYDKVGNLLSFTSYKEPTGANADAGEAPEVDVQKTYKYWENNLNYYTKQDKQTTTLTRDKSGRITKTKVTEGSTTYSFTHEYYADGRDKRTTVSGRAKGNSDFTYDANDKLVYLDKGKGDKQERVEYSSFVYNSDGQILYRFSDTGQDYDLVTETEYLFANGNSVGETGNTVTGEQVTKLDTDEYNLVQPLGEELPTASFLSFTVRANDSLQAIAASVYGNPSLWFVIAEANGLRGDETLKEGQLLQIPNNIKDGRITADTHKVYNESEIIGSTFPNLTPVSKKSGCGSFLAILIVVVIAVIAAFAVPALAGVVAQALGAGSLATASLGLSVASYAIAGAVVGAAASAIQQGLFIALGFQDKFSWKAVAAGAVSGALSGAAQAVGQAAKIAELAKSLESAQYLRIATRALQVASVASKQLIENGKITSWTSLATAALGPIRDATTGETLVKGLVGETTLNYVTPWLQLAETAIRNDGELKPADWAAAVGGTLQTAFSPNQPLGDAIFGSLGADSRRIITNLVVGGALSLFDRDAAITYLAESAGQEVGQLIGQEIVTATGLRGAAAAATADLQRGLVSQYRKPENNIAQRLRPSIQTVYTTSTSQAKVDPQELVAPTANDELAAPGISVESDVAVLNQLQADGVIPVVSSVVDQEFIGLGELENKALANQGGAIGFYIDSTLSELEANREILRAIPQRDIDILRARLESGDDLIVIPRSLQRVARDEGLEITGKVYPPITVDAPPQSFPALSSNDALALLARLDKASTFAYDEGTERLLLYVPKGVDDDAAKKSILLHVGRHASDGQIAILFDSLDAQRASGKSGFIDGTIAFNQSVYATIEKRARETGLDDFVQALSDGFSDENLPKDLDFGSQLYLRQLRFLTNLVGGIANNYQKNYAFKNDEYAPAALRDEATAAFYTDLAIDIATTFTGPLIKGGGVLVSGAIKVGKGFSQAAKATIALAKGSEVRLKLNPLLLLAEEPGRVQQLLYGARVGEGLPGTAGVKIPGRPTTQELLNLSRKHDVEFAVTYTLGPGKNGRGGYYTLYSGDVSGVTFGNVSADKILIAHTHPRGSIKASGYYELDKITGEYVFKGDQAVLKKLQDAGSPQKSSLIIPLERQDGLLPPPFRFTVDDKNIDYFLRSGEFFKKK